MRGQGRQQLAGVEAIRSALEAGAPVRRLLVRRGSTDTAVRDLVERARGLGVAVQTTSENDLRRMSAAPKPAELLALVGPDPDAPPEAVLRSGGAVWLLVDVRYPGNAGFAIRTAEVSGAAGVFLDADFDAEGRRLALRASMHADRFLPVHWEKGEPVIDAARSAGARVLALEDVGTKAPWEVDLTGSVLFVVGGEERGLSDDLLARSDATLRVPMAGFTPSYNLQAAMAAVASERLRQEAD